MQASYTKLRSGDWGIRVEGRVSVGQDVVVTKRDGSRQTATVERIVWSGEGVTLCSIRRAERGGGGRSRQPVAPVSAPRYDLSPEEVSQAFERLYIALLDAPLPTSDGGARTGSAEEFDLMHEEGGRLWFKHSVTRNYVILRSETIEIPRSGEPFARGVFDAPSN